MDTRDRSATMTAGGHLKLDYSRLFPEFATTLHFWAQELYAEVSASRCRDLFFLSREGQPLKKAFDIYQSVRGKVVDTHYLMVSRRSTLLASSRDIGNEDFHRIFRQYRRISIFEFLSSLGLEAHQSTFAKQIGLSEKLFYERSSDLPSSDIFSALIGLEDFRVVYGRERLRRRKCFLDYFNQLRPSDSTGDIGLVDVGWKGSIQDSIELIFSSSPHFKDVRVRGYYIGLLGANRTEQAGTKTGLLFSDSDRRRSGFHVFNENKSLFEVLLPADHGSTADYVSRPDGLVDPICDPFYENEMIATKVQPILIHLLDAFQRSVIESSNLGPIRRRDTVRGHSRIVFYPTEAEISWFKSIFHVENFGVFEKSHFAGETAARSLGDRVDFAVNLWRRRKAPDLGFWPWLALRNGLGVSASRMYALRQRLRSI